MELSSQEPQIPIPIPINSSYGGHNMIHDEPTSHNHTILPNGPIIPTTLEDPSPMRFKKMVRYRECLKNHAAAMGGNATDGCGEFMPSGEEGTLEALTCSACNCHRNFHRKEVEGEASNNSCCPFLPPPRKLIMGSLGYPLGGPFMGSRAAPQAHHKMIMAYNMGSLPNSESDDMEEGGGGSGSGMVGRVVKKRFRTKFTQEQKEKMFNFAEKVGWKIQKQEEAVVQQFCQEIGVKRRVLKVWMHNNKHNLAKKNLSSTSPPQDPI
ncbi:zinc-finger homeodomain protein 4-like [Diospyros lotus]|uniref:zinc-finger homeodomain protein 4-like n=1 Tax=Diospyros lotus TaxID=55363 RepID=UPI00224E6FD3|nr:zinc-finger homeodomain protein 4-like [Diospyros lotus]XP_052191968.1 zinc-finger homeodomain protein 4-like [Diospyros lotus]